MNMKYLFCFNNYFYTEYSFSLQLPLSLLLLLVSDVYVLIDFLTSVDTAFTVITVLIVPYFRWKQPDRPTTYRVSKFDFG